MVPNVRAVEQDLAFFALSDSGDAFSPLLMLVFHDSEKGRWVADAAMRSVQLLVALVADEHEVADVVEFILGNPLVAPRSPRAERVNVSLLGDVYGFLSDGGFPEWLVAAGKFTAPCRLSPEHALGRNRDVAFNLSRSVVWPGCIAGVTQQCPRRPHRHSGTPEIAQKIVRYSELIIRYRVRQL